MISGAVERPPFLFGGFPRGTIVTEFDEWPCMAARGRKSTIDDVFPRRHAGLLFQDRMASRVRVRVDQHPVGGK